MQYWVKTSNNSTLKSIISNRLIRGVITDINLSKEELASKRCTLFCDLRTSSVEDTMSIIDKKYHDFFRGFILPINISTPALMNAVRTKYIDKTLFTLAIVDDLNSINIALELNFDYIITNEFEKAYKMIGNTSNVYATKIGTFVEDKKRLMFLLEEEVDFCCINSEILDVFSIIF